MAREAVLVVLAISILVACTGCGRKLPPLPPEQVEPARISDAWYERGEVVVRVTCTVAGKVTLLGKAVGDCPQCLEGLAPKDEQTVDAPRSVELRDREPAAGPMVYRVRVVAAGGAWTGPPRIVEGPRANP
ncbi:MAG TPA: hypothetical protein PLS81_07800 [Deltaproteobacteria bacterium]|nr:hypothetical protein [Deltaproteobacteria bacterium]HOM29345.1 hypothetical protein [Deltaproteobacteria bacterium]HPP80329.1 hypothetical protein [Deltaproteobacteria bacterium]